MAIVPKRQNLALLADATRLVSKGEGFRMPALGHKCQFHTSSMEKSEIEER